MKWTCAAEPIWNLFGNPLISSLMTMMTLIDPPDSMSVPRQGPAAAWGILIRPLSPSPAGRRPGCIEERQAAENAAATPCWRPQDKDLDGRSGERKWTKKPLSPQIINRQLLGASMVVS